MFTIRAKYTDTVEINASVEKIRAFFADTQNFINLMPEVKSISIDNQGIAHWKIMVDVQQIGTFSQNFSVRLIEEEDDRVEWIPLADETRNFLRYSAELFEKSENLTMLSFTQMVEMRRRSAHEFHLFAGVAGESFISGEMNRRIAQMLKIFVQKAKQKLEN